MDYFGLLKRAWDITWRYKALWVLGLFAGAIGGAWSSGGGSYLTGSGGFERTGGQSGRWLEGNVWLVVIILGALVIVSIALWILGIAAQGGIAHATNEAAEGRAPALRDAWAAGFGKWGRTFMVQFVLGLPLFAIVLVFSMVVLALTAGLVPGDASVAAAGSVGLCFVVPLLGAVLAAVVLFIGIISPVAIRYGVLRDMTFGVAIKQAWNDLWAKKGLFVFWLVMLLPGIAYGVATAVVVAPAAVAVVLLATGEQYALAALVGLLLMLVLMVPNAIYATFVHSAWTLFFRTLAGLEPVTAAPAPASYAPPVYAPQQPDTPPPLVDMPPQQPDTPPGDE